MTAQRVYIISLCLFIFCLYLLRIWIIYQLTSMDTVYPQLLQETEEVKKENMQLNDKILESESFVTISDKAKRMGFTATPFIAP